MLAPHKREAAPAIAVSGSSVQLGGGDNQLLKQRRAARQRLKRLTAQLDALAVWKADIQCRLEHATELLEAGCLYDDQLDALIDAVAAWRMDVATVAIHLMRRAA